jgi:adenosylmethionine-8-amino-7-oxononanoate aminotransferase
MTGIQLAEHPPELRMGHRVTLEARSRSAIVRPLGDTVVLMPPLAISESDLNRLVEIVNAAIVAAARSVEPATAH